MRFQRRIKIFKGLNLNLSKSGIGFSAGPRGLKYSIGPSGTWLHTGLPGSGLSQRTKLSATGLSRSGATHKTISFTVRSHSDGRMEVLDEFGMPILDETLLRKIKRSEEYKDAIQQLSQDLKQEIGEESEKFVRIYRQTPKVLVSDYWNSLLSGARPKIHEQSPFIEPSPTLEGVRKILNEKAMQTFRSILFWKNAPRRREFVSKNESVLFEQAIRDWEAQKKAWVASEISKKAELDNKYKAEFDNYVRALNLAIRGDNDYLEDQVKETIEDIELPAQFSIDFDIKLPTLFLDLDLPEIEDMPIRKAGLLASGRVSVKEKSQKEQRSDYALCTTGMAFFFAATFFNISPAIERIVVSGYTQRRSSTSGNIEDQYIYSVSFPREEFINLNVSELVPYEAMQAFDHRLNLSTGLELRVISPLVS